MASEASPAVVLAARSMAVDQMTAEVVGAFSRAGIPSILLKGPSIARWLYPDDLRPYNDTDLLVSPQAFSHAVDVLRSLGFGDPSRGRAMHAHTYRRMDSDLPQPLCVDLHRSLPYLSAPATDAWKALSADTETMRVVDTEVAILAIPPRILHIAIHAVQHAFETQNPFEDLRRAIGAARPDQLEAAVALSRSLGAEDAFAAGLCLIPEGQAVIDRYGLTAQRRDLLRFGVEGDAEVGAAYQIQRVVDAASARERAAVFVDTVFVSPNVLRERSALARRGRTGLALAYAARPFILTGRIGPALAKRRRILRQP